MVWVKKEAIHPSTVCTTKGGVGASSPGFRFRPNFVRIHSPLINSYAFGVNVASDQWQFMHAAWICGRSWQTN
jgi:hypothetical protein